MRTIDRILVGTVLVLAVAVVAVVVLVLGVGLGDGSTDIERAEEQCATKDVDPVTGDEGKSIHLVASTPESMAVAGCVLDSLGAPDSLQAKLIDTRGVDGRQEDSWDDFTASWTYYSEDGLRIVIEQS